MNVELAIIIHNGWDRTLNLLNSIRENTKYPHYKITIIDNASTDCTVNELEKMKDEIYPIFNTRKFSYSACCNEILLNSLCEYVCFLTNEIEIMSKNWIEEFLKFSKRGNYYLVGPVKNICGSNIIGGVVGDDGSYYNLDESDENEKRIEWLHINCLFVKRNVIDKIEPFDNRFNLRYYEEVDFCIRAKEAGLKIGYCPLVEVNFIDNESSYFKRNQEENRVLFVNKHKEWLIKNKGKAIVRHRRRKG